MSPFIWWLSSQNYSSLYANTPRRTQAHKRLDAPFIDCTLEIPSIQDLKMFSRILDRKVKHLIQANATREKDRIAGETPVQEIEWEVSQDYSYLLENEQESLQCLSRTNREASIDTIGSRNSSLDSQKSKYDGMDSYAIRARIKNLL
jgi:hypothetical protein